MQPPEADVTWVKDNNMEVSWLYGKIILGREGALCSDLPGYLPRFACEKISRSKHRRWLVDVCVNMCVFDEWRWPMPGCNIIALRSVSCTTKTSSKGSQMPRHIPRNSEADRSALTISILIFRLIPAVSIRAQAVVAQDRWLRRAWS